MYRTPIIRVCTMVFAIALVAGAVPLRLAAQTQYFEQPRSIATERARFPQLLDDGERLVLIYQETTARDDARGTIAIRALVSADGRQWNGQDATIGPIPYSGSSPLVFSAVATGAGRIVIAVTAGAAGTQIWETRDGGASFAQVGEIRSSQTNVAPFLARGATGNLLLFTNQNLEGRQQIVVYRSTDGGEWTTARPLDSGSDAGLTFLPSHAVTADGRDVVVFQGLNISVRASNQLYLVSSADGGETWSESRRITDFIDPLETQDPDNYDNQRPNVFIEDDGTMVVAWERRFGTGPSQIYITTLDSEGRWTGLVEEVTGRFDLARAPRIVRDGSEIVLVWFTSVAGNSRVVLGRRDSFRWRATSVSPASGAATFAVPLQFNGLLHMAWQRTDATGRSDIVYLEPDQSVEPPTIVPANYRAGERSASEVARFTLRDGADAAGIRAYSVVWSRDPEAPVPREVTQRVPDRAVVQSANEDGPWYLRVRANDFAGNWSEPATATFVLDTTPPRPVSFPPPALDEDGYLASNTFQVQWNPSPDDDVAGYAVALQFLSSDPNAAWDGAVVPAVPRSVTTELRSTGRTNADDGLYVLAVAPVDRVGNRGAVTAIPLRTNKYIPVTRIFGTTVDRDAIGRYRLSIIGRGFDSNGSVRQIILDRDGAPPFDYEYNAWQGQFIVDGDRRISGVTVDDIDAGTYRLGVLHPERGLYFAPATVRFGARGTIVYGDFRGTPLPTFAPVDSERVIAEQDVIFLVVAAGAVLVIVASLLRLVSIGREIARLNLEARVLIAGPTATLVESGKENAKRMRAKGIGLRLKFAFFVVLLVGSVVVLVAVVLGRNVLQRQEEILVSGLQERIELLVEGQVTGARPALQNPSLNLDQLTNLANQGEAMADALYVTITGLGATGETGVIYATTDPSVVAPSDGASRIDTAEYAIGVSRVVDPISEEITALAGELNATAQAELGQIAVELAALSAEAQSLILAGADEADLIRIDEIRTDLLRRSQARLAELAGPIRSNPAFDFAVLDRSQTTYLFYKPVLDIVPGAGADFSEYYRGTIRVGISTQLILDEIDATRRDLIVTTFLVAVAAVAVGIAGAIALATVIVIPIDRLVRLVDEISRTEDKAQLKGRSITLRSRDELNLLATSINSMTAGLVKAAEADKDLKFGKETQKAFIPLEVIDSDSKRTFGALIEPSIEFFGYYEGAKGVSGDYFTYQKLSDRFFAVIKCDVAGKGIPAALIMVQVATVFQDYFRNWSVKSPGLDVASLVLRINDIVAERQFKGRFAALTAGIIDAAKGEVHLANAGDNQLHVYRRGAGEVEQLTLPGGPAAGTFSSADIPMTYPQQVQTMAIGDILLLFTDGLEEAKRLLRNEAFEPIKVTEEMREHGDVPEEFGVETDGEEFTNPRIHAIVRAVQNRTTYRLEKVLDPVGEPLEFDFSTCDNPARDAVLAIVSAERIFRLVPMPDAGPQHQISVDRTIDEFLQRHFVQYDRYFSHRIDREGLTGAASQYVQFSHMKEDEQFDDITMLAVIRKR